MGRRIGKTRRLGTRSQHKTLLLICEGKETEKVYFEDVKREGNYNVKIVTPKTNGVNVQNLIDQAEIQKKRYAISYDEGDRVYCVFDRDRTEEDQFSRAKKKAERLGVELIMSNPSFEVWYWLHTLKHFSTRYLEQEKLEREISNYLDKGYDKSRSYYKLLKSNLKQAIDFARKLEDYHFEQERCLPSLKANPSTMIHQIFEYMEEISSTNSK